jgi:hypothetical protein
MKSISPFRLEEIPVIAGFTHANVTRPDDARDFLDYSSIYTAPYFVTYLEKIRVVNEKINTEVLEGELKLLTANLYLGINSLRPRLNKLEGYINRATGLTVGPKDFRLKYIRRHIGRKDVEKFLLEYSTLLQLVDKNVTALKAKGLKDADITILEGMRGTISTGNTNQNLKEDAIEALVQANKGLILELWTMTADLLDAGKRIYKYTNAEKVNDYTATKLLQRIRHEKKKEEEAEPEVEMGILEITITNKADDKPLMGAEYEVLESGDTNETDAEGEGNEDLRVGTYTVAARMDGFVEKTVSNVVITKDNTTDLKIELEPEPPEPAA